MAINTVVTRGFGNGTFVGTIALVTLRGFLSSGVVVAVGAVNKFKGFVGRNTGRVGKIG